VQCVLSCSQQLRQSLQGRGSVWATRQGLLQIGVPSWPVYGCCRGHEESRQPALPRASAPQPRLPDLTWVSVSCSVLPDQHLQSCRRTSMN